MANLSKGRDAKLWVYGFTPKIAKPPKIWFFYIPSNLRFLALGQKFLFGGRKMNKKINFSKVLLAFMIVILMVPFSLIVEAGESVGAGAPGVSEVRRNVIVGFKDHAPGLADRKSVV